MRRGGKYVGTGIDGIGGTGGMAEATGVDGIEGMDGMVGKSGMLAVEDPVAMVEGREPVVNDVPDDE